MSKKMCKKCGAVNSGGYNPEAVSIGAWVGILIVLSIPIINFIALLLMTFGSDNESIKNFAKASLILMVVGLGIIILFGGYSAFM